MKRYVPGISGSGEKWRIDEEVAKEMGEKNEDCGPGAYDFIEQDGMPHKVVEKVA